MAFILHRVFKYHSFTGLKPFKLSLKKKESFNNNYFINCCKHLFESKVESGDQADGEDKYVRFLAKTGFLVTAILTGSSLKQLQAGKDNISEVSITPLSNNIGQTRNASGKFVKKSLVDRLRKLQESIAGPNEKRKLNFAENTNENTCTPTKRILRNMEVRFEFTLTLKEQCTQTFIILSTNQPDVM